MNALQTLQFVGGMGFGAVIGWITYFILRRAQPKSLSDIATIIGILGGATIVQIFDPKGWAFPGYGIGLAVGFFLYYLNYYFIIGKRTIRDTLTHPQKDVNPVLGGDKQPD